MKSAKRRRCSVLLLVGLCLTHAAPSAQAQVVDDEVIRVNTELVVVDAQVLNKKTGHIIGALGRSDFQLYEDGVRQEITFFSQDKLPLSVVLLFDLTDTVRPVLTPLARGALEALAHLKPEDEVAVMTYAASAQLIQDFTTDRRLIVAAIEQASAMQSDEAAFFNEGVFQASVQSRQAHNPSSRQVIIWLTDNVPNVPSESMRKKNGRSVPEGQLHTEKEAFTELFESGSVVCGLLARSGLSKLVEIFDTKNPLFALGRKHHPPGDVYKYAEQTGGEVLRSNKEEVSSKLAELFDHLRTRYSLGYRPAVEQPPGKFCKLKLTVTPGVEQREGKVLVKARAGYYREVKRKAQPGVQTRPRLVPQ
ncbi:MAG: VWA domain-containing protein [Pyrinomonadaceae bacterium]